MLPEFLVENLFRGRGWKDFHIVVQKQFLPMFRAWSWEFPKFLTPGFPSRDVSHDQKALGNAGNCFLENQGDPWKRPLSAWPADALG